MSLELNENAINTWKVTCGPSGDGYARVTADNGDILLNFETNSADRSIKLNTCIKERWGHDEKMGYTPGVSTTWYIEMDHHGKLCSLARFTEHEVLIYSSCRLLSGFHIKDKRGNLLRSYNHRGHINTTANFSVSDGWTFSIPESYSLSPLSTARSERSLPAN